MTTTTHLQQTLEQVLGHLVDARAAAKDTDLQDALHEVELTLYEVCDLPARSEPTTGGVTHTHDALVAAEHALDGLPRAERPLWLLPLRTEVAILRRRSTT